MKSKTVTLRSLKNSKHPRVRERTFSDRVVVALRASVAHVSHTAPDATTPPRPLCQATGARLEERKGHERARREAAGAED